MSEQKTVQKVNGITLQKGKVYLRDRRTGMLHQYEDLLAQMSHMDRFVFEGELPSKEKHSTFSNINQTALERAADFDRLASMKAKDREAELAKRKKYATEQEELQKKAERQNPPERKLELVNPDGPSLEAFYEQGWKDELLVEAGHAKWVE